MPRKARTVFSNIPHHITQRGNRREEVFFTDEGREKYLKWLKEYCERHRVEILAYCLMTNHIHLVAVPTTDTGLQDVLRPLHMRYAQYINRQRGWKGHVWQGRYFSSPLDEQYMWAAIRYVERNPVRARMVRKAEDYRWSSAATHCQRVASDLLTSKLQWKRKLDSIENWSGWVAEGEGPEVLSLLRRNADKGLPCGSERFVEKLERQAGKMLAYRPIGRPKKQGKG